MVKGKVVFVGSGPGDPEMMTVRSIKEIENCDILFYDASIDDSVINIAPARTEKIRVGDPDGHFDPKSIGTDMAEAAMAGKKVVRLKTGDPSIFCKTDIEIESLKEYGIDYCIVPGISTAFASAAAAGIVLTDSRLSSAVCLATGMESRNGRKVDWKKIASCADTVIVYLGSRDAERYVGELISGGMEPDMPVKVICNATLKNQRILNSRLSDLPVLLKTEGEYGCLVIIGKIASVP